MKTSGRNSAYLTPLLFLFVTLYLLSPLEALGEAPPRFTLEMGSPQKFSLIVGKSMIVKTNESIKRASIGAPEIADALVLTARQISLIGKAPGITNLTLWDLDNKVSAILDLEVSPDISRLKEMLANILPEEKEVKVTATHDNITLSGTVSSLSKRDQILALAEPFFPKKVVNLLKLDSTTSDKNFLRLEEVLQKILPEEKEIRVTAIQDKVALSGTVSSKSKMDQVVALSESLFPKGVVNLLQVAGTPDVFLSNISRFKETLHDILPEEKEIKVTTTNNMVTLSGTVSSASNLSQVLALADSFFPGEKDKPRVINLLEVAGVHQVMVEVRVAEMSRSLSKRLGINVTSVSSSGKTQGLSLLNNLIKLPAQDFLRTFIPELEISSAINAILRFMSSDTSWTALIDALKEEGLLKVLAEPTLITLSGKTANFLAGGEFPVPVPQTGFANAITIEYKPFGVGLNFTPTVLSSKKISMHVAPEVSELDFSNGISLSGFVIPALTTRRVSTVIELGDGQSFAIAGLLKDNVREIMSKFPVLGDIPILGALFRSSSFQKNETELIIIVTPHLVRPLDLAKQTLPTDQFIEPDDFEFYLLGTSEGKGTTKRPGLKSSSSNPNKELEGSFGHIIPK
jgi:pilus assembly protein CpaC